MADGTLRKERPLDPVREMQALDALKLALADEIRDDPDFLLDLAEGETSLFEVIDALVSADALDAGLIEGVELAQRNLGYRKERFETRTARRRALLEQAMMMLEVKKLERPAATLSLANRKPKVEVTDESAIPSEFFKSEPKLDKKALNAAVEAIMAQREAEFAAAKAESREPAPPPLPDGVTLGNGSQSITIRRK